ncbi:hypothetical protein SAMD00023353_1600550 [Rosellinia necatrix]|uniref:ER membrane protein complex subunit 7 beta-sandwich domain-containing protein n=1 Tax=Rosellinia necatrix TaxID=77044 RepID=A0A1W2TIF3_ROSNE|nr:hypothetical protein SAMD00023353_1600550 [Rosellinia necatrix]
MLLLPLPKPTLAAAVLALSFFSSMPSLASATTTTTTVTFSIPASPQIPNPAALPPSTHATLTALGASLAAPLTASDTFVFRNVTPGSYLADVHGATHGFAPLRVDVVIGAEGEGDGEGDMRVRVRVWETFRGNDWANKGEEILPVAAAAAAGVAAFPVKVLGSKIYYTDRGSFSVFGILKNPMILMGLVSLALFIGMPKLVENMDPETRAEFEEQSKKNPMNSLMSGPQAGGSPMGNFDVAGFLAGQGSGKKDEPDTSSGPGNGGKRGGKK